MENMEKNKQLKIIKWAFIIVSIIHIIYAAIAMRGLYEDGSFYMMRLLNNFTYNVYNIVIDPEHTRYFMFLINQLPLLFFRWICCINNKFTLIMIYSFTQFFLPFLFLLFDYRLTKRTKRIDIFFWDLFCYCAVLLTFSIFSVTESLYGVTFHFILWNYMAAKIDYTKKDIAAVIFLITVMFATYEYVVYLGIIFFIASIYYSLNEKNTKRAVIKFLIGIGALAASIFNLMYMIRIPDEKGEIARFFREFHDYFPHLLELNSLISVITLVLLVIYLFKKKKITNFSIYIICFIYFLAIFRLINTIDISLAPMWETHMRTIPCWALPLIFLAVYICDLLKKEINKTKISNLICIVLICGITQTCWQMVNTYYWNKNIQYLKAELKKTDDLLYIPSEHEEISTFFNEKLRRYIWHGTYAALSILLSDTYEIKPLLLNYDEEIEPATFRNYLYAVPGDAEISIPMCGFLLRKNQFWDLTEAAKALDKYNKEHNIEPKEYKN